MKKTCFLITYLVCSLVVFCSEIVNAQDTVQKIELKIAPFRFDYARFDPFEDLDSAELFIIINNSALLNFSNDKFYNMLKSSDKKKIDYAIATDYRVKCIIFLYSGKSEVLYMNRFGEFWYKNNTYKNKRIKGFIFEHIPKTYKE